jgi:polyferredoxin
MVGLQAGAPSPGDAWHFQDDDEVAPTTRRIVGRQAGELIILMAFFALALAGFFKKSERLKTFTLVAAVAYLGIYRSQLISIVNIFSLLHAELPLFTFNLAWYLFAGFTVMSTVLWGRLYCGRVCAFGAMTQLLDRVVPVRLRVTVPRRLEQRAAYLKYALLAGTVGYFLLTRDPSIYKYVEPFWMFSGKATIAMWGGLAVLLAATVCVRNLYCRFLCPVGAFLGLLSNVTVFRIKRWSECRTCKICEKACEWGAIAGPRIIASECVRCDDCERLYMDQQNCPHWIVLRRKSDFTARPSAAPVP